ncbi:MAG: permease [Clostridia bacterium]|nr:permease [Clostridia bacterium]
MENMMTHYMELLATNQPWNLIIFMAIPVILAETIAVTELGILFSRNLNGGLRAVNRIASIIVGLYFTGIFVYLFTTAVIPLTSTGGWRGPADVIAVGFYLLGIVPLLGMALLDMGIIGRKRNEVSKLKLHATFVGIFLVVAHIAMIFGMLDPGLLMMDMAGM